MRSKLTSRPRMMAVALVALLVGGIALPAGADHEALVDVSLGNAYEQNFNLDDGTWTTITPPAPPTHDWQVGAPTSGPGVAFSGSNVWATNLAGNYMNSDCGGIISPSIDLTTATSASISFQQWRHMEESTLATGSAFDAGMLFVSTDGGGSWSVLQPAGGYTSKSIGTTSRACLFGQPSLTKGFSGPPGTVAPPPVYSPIAADLLPYLGQTVQVMIAFASDGSVGRAGWYVDDFGVTVDGSTTVQDFEGGAGGFTALSMGVPKAPNGWEWGTQTTGPGAAPNSDPPLWATNLDGNYGFNECSSITSPSIDLSLGGTPLPKGTKATLRWQQWYQSSSVSAGGVVQVSEDGANWTNIVPTTGYPGNPTSSLDACLKDDTQATGAFAGTTLSATGGPMTDFAADLTPYLAKQIQVRFLFASTGTAVLDEGWYVDNVSVETKVYVGAPHLEPPSNLPPGWSTGGDNGSWAYGAATAGPAGETAFGTNLGGNYNHSECSYIESPAVPGAALAANPALSFTHWYKIESIFSTLAWDGGVVLVSADDGATWTYLDLPEYSRPAYSTALKSCLATHGLPATTEVFSGDKQTFDTVTADLSAFSSAPTVKVRFVFGSDSSVAYDGWFIKTVQIAGVPLVP